MSDFDNRDEEEKKETSLEENKGKEPSDKKEEKTDKPEKEYEDVCFHGISDAQLLCKDIESMSICEIKLRKFGI